MFAKLKGIFYGYFVLATAFLGLVVMSGLVSYPFGLYVRPLTDDFGWNRAQIMGGFTTFSLTMGILAPFIGRLVRRYGARLIMSVGALITTAGFFLLSLTMNLWYFYLLYFIIAIGCASMGIVPASTVVSNWFKKKRGLAIGILGTGIGFGGFFGPLIVGSLMLSAFGWRQTYFLCGVFVIAVVAPALFFVIRTKPSEMGLNPDGVVKVEEDGGNTPAKDYDKGIDLPQALKMPVFWMIALAFLTFGFANSATWQNQTPYLEDIGIATAVAASTMSAVAIGSGSGKFGFGWLCDFVHSKYALALGIISQAVSVVILMNITSTTPMMVLWLYAILFGLGIGSWLPSLSITISTIFGLSSYGVIFGIMSMMWMGGGSLGPTVAGMIYDANGSYYYAFLLSLLLYAIALPSILLVKYPRSK